MTVFRAATVNILNDLSLWEERRGLLAEGLKALNLDVLAVQEAVIPVGTAEWLAGQLGMTEVYLTPKSDHRGRYEGIAILSKHRMIDRDWLDLGSQSRVVQKVRLEIEGQTLTVVNGHFYWWPGDSKARLAQVERLLDWTAGEMEEPLVVCGDFNATPERPSIVRMQEVFSSAYAAHHGREPDYTCPTPLQQISAGRTIRQVLIDLAANKSLKPWRGTLDYVFINAGLKVRDCRVVLDKPDARRKKLYPSDHFGLMAELEFIHDG